MEGTSSQIKRGLVAALLGLGICAPSIALAECTLIEVKKAEGAQIKVYFTKFPQEDTSKGAYKACKILKAAAPGASAFFVTPFRQDATVVVHKSNWPG
jgi:hypothetical protein